MCIAATLLVGCNETRNPDFCCITEETCREAGANELLPCPEGLACIDGSCEPASCALQGCGAAAPVCDTTTDMCLGCTSAGDCGRFSAMPVCDSDGGGACVECVDSGDCGVATKPVCDAHACRGCVNDTECSSGACGDDGACVEETNVVYLSANGSDNPACSKVMPCKTAPAGFQQLNATRTHVVFEPGSYSQGILVATTAPPAPDVVLHGNGAQLNAGTTDVPALRFTVPTTMRDLVVTNSASEGFAIQANAVTTIERSRVKGPFAISAAAATRIRDSDIEATVQSAITNSGSLTIERSKVHGGKHAITSSVGTLDVTNTIIYDTTLVGLDLGASTGLFKFCTIAHTGTTVAETEAFGARCGGAITFRSSIIWSQFVVNNESHTPVELCTSFDGGTIVGPKPVGGAASTNPSFIDVNSDFHLNGNSPARDAVDTGPALDFEGDPRPRGARYDVGADEAP